MPDADDALPELTTTLGLRSGPHSWGSERRMALLSAIGTEGSISAAARKVGMSYKAAWDAVEMMNHAFGSVLVERVAGGRSGGGASLTADARRLLDWFTVVQEEHRKFIDRLARFGPGGVRHLGLMQRLALQTSARNRFQGMIQALEPLDAVNDRVDVAIDAGCVLQATVTRASSERLNLVPGAEVLAILKAQAVDIGPLPGKALRGQTQWVGTIVQVEGAGGAIELTLSIGSRVHITGLAGAEWSADRLPLVGGQARARFHAGDVLLATWD